MSKYKCGEIVTGYVTGIEKYGIFVCIDDQIDGLIHISEITKSYVRNINDYAKVGEVIRAKVIEEENNNQIKLSIKDIDYRITRKKSTKIEETEKGFSTLIIMLNKWIDQKTEEISQKK
ncbi:MAG: S1 RNA-binding domain-containing protein [Bacilli bacterium]|nr:S1 RNA-binding domain-containing protein [Bacilli bacterium]